jgi:MFS family permease
LGNCCFKFATDPVWWFFLFWIPDYLQRVHGLHLTQIGPPILVIYIISDVGSVAGGWFSSTLIHRGLSMNAARKWAMFFCALLVLPICFVYRLSGLWSASILIGLAAAGHQGFSANLYTLSSDLFPSRAVASVVGIGGMAGAIGGMLAAEIVGHILQWTGSYMIPFFIASSAYLLALLFIHLLSPKLIPRKLDTCNKENMPLCIKTKDACRWDLISLGEVMLRFDPGEYRIWTARDFRVSEGGGEYNVARGLKRCFGLEHRHRHRLRQKSRRFASAGFNQSGWCRLITDPLGGL